ncbi:MAG TPA: hypothetical protein VM282_27410 [Acidimicrobiales bacterium]|nr:hypothetical protein [Acidimicrobiales bacterium]
MAALVNHNGPDATFGVAASIDRWDGEEWVPHRRLVMCLDHWFCTAEPQGLDEEFAVPLIGLGARVGAAGPAERFTTKGLARGWYRISQTAHEGFVAAALLQVVDGVGQIAPLVPLGEPAISIAPALVAPAGATVHLSPWCRGATVRSLSAMSSAR